ncbi:hypothetical protein [Enterococcus gilvus]|jgi:hypothetical protein|uniref:Uncharacterized protein n=1 Tax=Enterococcus gilvus ATCC BAA-350 TaxID=1158614 RepID=R2V887_9ENTE|nr:hypothetical protein [Enterococcus gilvus]AXG39492.1 hypothetical protein EGCR1_12670 [Enterococcus gilvus]EOI53935.1 hypothetical protein UKC_03888 [Enterococcus gilvus ATCC BAA-350]EOW80790.1 hypothetical protein I592_00074 [Enterococcus gilvus ATCC BAA-350]MBS5821204.1 hypothetical protein [Enterococcus gilvus]OJG41372.1 hypothetical protein RV02_GL000959 [Enterococcus gilvus]
MYTYVWISAAIGGVVFILSVFFLMRDMSYCDQNGKLKGFYLMPNFGLFILAIGWIAMAVALYLMIQKQLVG